MFYKIIKHYLSISASWSSSALLFLTWGSEWLKASFTAKGNKGHIIQESARFPETCKRCCFGVLIPRLLLSQELNGPRSNCGFPEETIMISFGRKIESAKSWSVQKIFRCYLSSLQLFQKVAALASIPSITPGELFSNSKTHSTNVCKGGELNHLPIVFMSGFSSHFLTTMSGL